VSENGIWLAATGDLMMNRPLIRNEMDERTNLVYRLLKEADLAFVNLEVPLTDRGIASDKIVSFRADPVLAGELKAIGTDIVTFANNHAMDFGPEGFLQTLDALDQVGMPRVGAGRNLAEALAPTVLEVGGLKVAFVGFATTLPAGSAARQDRAGIAPIKVFTRFVVDSEAIDEQPGMAPYVETEALAADVEQTCAAVRAAAAQADVVIVGMHWGVPHGWVPSVQDALATYQRPLAHALIDAGASAIIGNHAHVLHGVEFYRGAPIIHCLGNFLFHRLATGAPLALSRNYPPYSWRSLRSPINRLSAVARLRLTSNGVAAVELVPIVINELGEPILAAPAEQEEILAMLQELSSPLGTRIRAEGGRAIAEPEGGVVR
jgi:poly-gamma-glutamate capsule biosynthesis protein CapA/YwtB (metallophosphatase superfamily)